jgi:Flp pilus assembly protein TadG
MGRTLGRPRGGRRGQAMVELALAIPILLIVLGGIFEFGMAWQRSQVVTDAARQGARTASLLSETGVGQDSVETVVERALRVGGIDPDDAEIDVVGFQAGTGTQVTVTVEAEYEFWLLGPFFRIARGDWDDETVTLKARAVMRNE